MLSNVEKIWWEEDNEFWVSLFAKEDNQYFGVCEEERGDGSDGMKEEEEDDDEFVLELELEFELVLMVLSNWWKERGREE